MPPLFLQKSGITTGIAFLVLVLRSQKSLSIKKKKKMQNASKYKRSKIITGKHRRILNAKTKKAMP
ncbi:hypothetical protein AGMMS49531_02680 [Endomicrobiia bacterium]|nr:hypothetical protein AGMMS49531_02680 [Endomicrobiia bacterium]